jgi:restriction endonuclease Mrr
VIQKTGRFDSWQSLVVEEPMAIPGYQEFMLPLVQLAADGKEHKITDAIDTLADQFGVSEQDREIQLPSGTQTRLYNRVTWALTYLTKAYSLRNRDAADSSWRREAQMC